MKRYLAELIGTFLLVFFGTGAILVNEVSKGAIAHIGICLAFSMTLAAVIYMLGDISGAHVNPAVSLGFWLTGRFPRKEFIYYAVSQTGGALLASLVLKGLFPTDPTLASNAPPFLPPLQAFLLEALLTCILMFTILNVATTDCKLCPKTGSPTVGVTIGFILFVIALVGGPLTGASLNPARSIAPALITGSNLNYLWLYIFAPCLGALVAVPLFNLQRLSGSEIVAEEI